MREAPCFDRRQALGALAGSLFLSLGGGKVLIAADPRIRSTREATRRRIIHWIFDGGLSQEVWDPKPGSPREIRGELAPIDTTIPGVQFSEVSPHLAQLANRLTIIRTVKSSSEFHDRSTRDLLWLEGKRENYLQTIGVETGPNDSVPLAYVESNFPGRGDGLSGTSNAVRSMNDPLHQNDLQLDIEWDGKTFCVPDGAVDRERVRQRIDLLEVLQKDRLVEGPAVERAMRNWELAGRILTDGVVPSCSSIDRENEVYGTHQLGQAALIAKQLVLSGVPCVDVRTGHWDFHENITPLLRQHFPDADQALAGLVKACEAGELPDTIIGASTEFGRSPTLNNEGGRHHWISAHTELFYGGIFEGGKLIGATDDTWLPTTDSVPIEHVKLLAMHAAGVELLLSDKQKIAQYL